MSPQRFCRGLSSTLRRRRECPRRGACLGPNPRAWAGLNRQGHAKGSPSRRKSAPPSLTCRGRAGLCESPYGPGGPPAGASPKGPASAGCRPTTCGAKPGRSFLGAAFSRREEGTCKKQGVFPGAGSRLVERGAEDHTATSSRARGATSLAPSPLAHPLKASSGVHGRAAFHAAARYGEGFPPRAEAPSRSGASGLPSTVYTRMRTRPRAYLRPPAYSPLPHVSGAHRAERAFPPPVFSAPHGSGEKPFPVG